MNAPRVFIRIKYDMLDEFMKIYIHGPKYHKNLGF